MPGGTHEETPLPVRSIVDRAPGFFAKAGMLAGMGQGEVASSKEFELVDCKPQEPVDVSRSNGESFITCWNEGHVVMVK